MPTLILTLTCFLTTLTIAPLPSPTLPSHPTLATLEGVAVAPPALIGLLGDVTPGRSGWLLFEAEDGEESDDDGGEQGTELSAILWCEPQSPFGTASSNPHPTVIPRSALRSPVLRC